MEIISRPFNGRNYWKKKGYNLLDGSKTRRRNLKIVKIDGGSDRRRRFWRLSKARPKLKLMKAMIGSSPKRLWNAFKDGYINMMLRLAGNVGQVNGGSFFQGKRISKARSISVKYSQDDFETKLILEIYKALSTSKGISEVM